MVALSNVLRSAKDHPRYTVVRGLGRFDVVRNGVVGIRQRLTKPAQRRYLEERAGGTAIARRATTESLGDAAASVGREVQAHGLALGLELPDDTVDAIRQFADTSPCFADRDPHLGFHLDDRSAAERRLGKTILVAQYFNTVAECSAIADVAGDPLLQSIAAHYLQSVPKLVGVNLWWTFPVAPAPGDQDRHAHRFHRDLDDVDFLKFFFYLTPVSAGDGAHVCVLGSHDDSTGRPSRLDIRRHTDAEVEDRYSPDDIVEICGPAGTGFAETTRCLHKGRTPTRQARLALQLEFAHFDHGVMHDTWPTTDLRMLALDDGSLDSHERPEGRRAADG